MNSSPAFTFGQVFHGSSHALEEGRGVGSGIEGQAVPPFARPPVVEGGRGVVIGNVAGEPAPERLLRAVLNKGVINEWLAPCCRPAFDR